MNTTLCGLTLALLLPLAAQAQPPAHPHPDQPMDTRLLQRKDLPYHFSTLDLDSADGQRHYRLWIGKPDRPAPASGYPVLWMLDGNAALGALEPSALQALTQGQAPLLVAIGYQSGRRIERDARTYDYTPPVPGRAEQRDPLTDLPSGGVDAFLDLLQQRMRPRVAERAPLDPHRQTLWGHSYGGLAVLHALLARPGLFSDYVAASPSLWWNDGAILAEVDGLDARLHAYRPHLWLMRGGEEPGDPRNAPGKDREKAMDRLRAQLASTPQVQVEYRRFDGLGHGPMLPASLAAVLQRLSTAPAP